MESASCALALKPSLYNNRPIHNNYFRPGNTRLPLTSSLARGNTHFPRTWCLARGRHPHSAHLSLARSRPQGFGSLPINRPQETPYPGGGGTPISDLYGYVRPPLFTLTRSLNPHLFIPVRSKVHTKSTGTRSFTVNLFIFSRKLYCLIRNRML